MIIEIVIPQVGEAISEVTLLQWFKKEGERVEKGEPLFEVDTEKAVIEIEAFNDGVLKEILVPDHSPVMPKQVVGRLETIGENDDTDSSTATSTLEKDTKRSVSPIAQRLARELNVDLEGVAGSGLNKRVMAKDVKNAASPSTTVENVKFEAPVEIKPLASPKAKALAKELGVDLSQTVGTGVDGLITVNDVQAAAQKQTNIDTSFTLLEEDMPKSLKIIAARMLESKQTIPHFYLTVEVDMTQVQILRRYCTEALGWDKAPTYSDIFVRACAITLKKLPDLNIVYQDGKIIHRESIDIGIAVGTENELIVPVLKNADQISLQETQVDK